MKFEIELTSEQVAQFHLIHSTRSNRTPQQLFEQIVERGCYTLAYRSRYNTKRYADQQVEREAFKEWKASAKASK